MKSECVSLEYQRMMMQPHDFSFCIFIGNKYSKGEEKNKERKKKRFYYSKILLQKKGSEYIQGKPFCFSF